MPGAIELKRETADTFLSRIVVAILIGVVSCSSARAQDESQCFGTTSEGALENGWMLPARGKNFRSYSATGRMLGRTYVHSIVHNIVVAAYSALDETLPEATFVYGETGKKAGGEFSPHKTHQNGLSVDFMVPLVNAEGESVPMRTSIFNKWGYDLEFDQQGRLDDLRIDAEAMSEHIYQLHKAALREGVDIWRVIFDPELQFLLEGAPRWSYLKNNVRFSGRRSWVRHDDHYHIDFELACEPLA